MARKYHRIISTLAVGGLLAAFAPGAYAASATELGTTVTLGYIIPDIITWRMAHLLLMISTLLL